MKFYVLKQLGSTRPIKATKLYVNGRGKKVGKTRAEAPPSSMVDKSVNEDAEKKEDEEDCFREETLIFDLEEPNGRLP